MLPRYQRRFSLSILPENHRKTGNLYVGKAWSVAARPLGGIREPLGGSGYGEIGLNAAFR